MITIIDYGLGNLGSIISMLNKIGVKSEITNDVKKIETAEKIILPGVGKFDAAISKIEELNLSEALNKKAKIDKIPILGICLGMQLLTNSSEEGVKAGFGWIDAKTVRFNFSEELKLKVPHMGWNLVKKSEESQLTKNFEESFRYYFVHSYYVRVENEKNSILKTNYGICFDSGIQSENIYGVQFHPEKSHKFGMALLKNFSDI